MDTVLTKQRKYVGLGNDEASIGALEGEILKHLWDAGEPQSSVQVYAAIHFARRDEKREMQSPSTIAVTLSRMVQKGLLTVARQGERTGRPGRSKGYYMPTKTRAEVTAAALDDTSRRLTGQPLGYLLTCLNQEGASKDPAMAHNGLDELIQTLKHLNSEREETPVHSDR